MAIPPDATDHVYSIFINAEPERIWRAITNGDDTVQYYFGTRVTSDWRPVRTSATTTRTGRSRPMARSSGSIRRSGSR